MRFRAGLTALAFCALAVVTAGPAGAGGSAPTPPCAAATSTGTFTQSTPVRIPPDPMAAIVESQVAVSGVGPYLVDVNAQTLIEHDQPSNLEVTLTSPAGTVVTLTSDNGGIFEDVFNGTMWDDDADPDGQVPYSTNDGLVTDHDYTSSVAASLVPEEAMGAFIGENPNGTWTLTINDDDEGTGGTLNDWGLILETAASTPPAPTVTSAVQNTPVPISGSGTPVVTSTVTIAGAPLSIAEVTAVTNLAHDRSDDLDVTLESPAGTVVTLTSGNATNREDAFDGTMWADDADPGGGIPGPDGNVASDAVYRDGEVQPSLVPEEAMAAFIGEDPNGTWTLTISDHAPGDAGTLTGWELHVGSRASAPPTTLSPFNELDDVAIPAAFTSTIVNTSTILVTGARPYLWDADVTTFLRHTFPGDLQVTVTSPAGTVVTLVTRGVGGVDDVFNGTLWDDDADPDGQVPYMTNDGLVTDAEYAFGIVETPLAPEEPLGAFIGENPNGPWTFTVHDASDRDGGVLTSWSLTLTTLFSAPGVGSTSAFTQPSAVAVPDETTVTSTLVVSGVASYLTDLDVTTMLSHEEPTHLDVTLQSPGGTVVTLTTDNSMGRSEVFDGTVWDDAADPDGQVPYASNDGLVTDALYANGVVETPLAPEEPLAAFIGEDPNGSWTLTVSDDFPGFAGNLASWGLDVTTVTCPPPPPPPPAPPPAAGADLAVEATADPAEPAVAETMTVTGTVANAGPGAATAASLVFDLPPAAEVGDVPDGCDGDDTVTCALGGVVIGGEVERSIEVVFSDAGSHEIKVTASAVETDPDPADNAATLTIDVSAAGPGVVGSDDLIDTAVDVSEQRFPDAPTRGAPTAPAFAVLARADVFADALGGSVLLGDAPVLFTAGDVLDPRTQAELQRLGVATTYLLGGEQALSAAVADALTADGITAERLAGPSRIETSVAVAEEAIALGIADGAQAGLARAFGTADGDESRAWADSISGGGWAASEGVPILLTATEELHPAVAAFLQGHATATTVLLGGTAALADAVQATVPGPQRIAGANRFATAAAVAEQLLGVAPDGARGYLIVNGGDPDAWGFGIVAAGLVADSGRPILLIGDTAPPETLQAVTGCGDQVALTAIGGPTLVDPAILTELDQADTPACNG